MYHRWHPHTGQVLSGMDGMDFTTCKKGWQQRGRYGTRSSILKHVWKLFAGRCASHFDRRLLDLNREVQWTVFTDWALNIPQSKVCTWRERIFGHTPGNEIDETVRINYSWNWPKTFPIIVYSTCAYEECALYADGYGSFSQACLCLLFRII